VAAVKAFKEPMMNKPTTMTEAQVEPTAPESQTKKSYAPPAIIYRAPLEVTAGTCEVASGGKGDLLCSNQFS
jgi:hypothetical protein